ncbi:MAG: hypothetical protein CL693_06975 [Cellvibrionaceae bacterium]|nr:hypothetical protein [Cellvibrionaceae bacterium]|tara:strand:- start:41680 stop:42426 length:747 start_codon:yes stop_codon:yes gene_type:complete
MEFSHNIAEWSFAPYILLGVGSFVATLTGSLLGVGGGFIILGVLSILLPINILIPVLAAVLACIDLSRSLAFRNHIHTPIFYPFLLGCIIGVTGGITFFLSLPKEAIGTGLAILILLSLIIPVSPLKWNIKYPFVWIGTIHSFLSTMFGYGGIFQAAVMQTSLAKMRTTATLASSFLMLELMKVASYVANGFSYQSYLGIILAAACGAVPASIIGRKLAHQVSLKFYRTGQRIILGVIAINILIGVWY